MQTRQKVEQVKVYFSAVKHPHSPLHKAMKTQGDANWDRASFGWVKPRTQNCKYASWQNSSKPRSGKPIPASLWDTPARKLGKALRRMAKGKTESEIKLLIQENSKPQDLIVYTDGSVTKDQPRWGFTVKLPSMKTMCVIFWAALVSNGKVWALILSQF